jgi:hypothetical protein
MKEYVETLAAGCGRDQHLVPEELAAGRQHDLTDVGESLVPAGLPGVAIERDVLVVLVHLEQGVAQLADIDSLAIDIVDGTEHQPDP